MKVANIAWIQSFFALSRVLCYVDRPDHRGTEFIFGYLDNYSPGSPEPLELYLTTDVPGNWSVNVSIPLRPSDDPHNLKITNGSVKAIYMNPSLRMSGNSRENKGIHIQAEAEIVVYAVNKDLLSADGFVVLPVDVLGTEYTAASWKLTRTNRPALIGVVAAQDNTLVNFTFPTGRDVNVTWSGTSYGAGDTLGVTCNRFQTIQITSDADLTGTIVTSSKPIALNGGNKQASIYGLPTYVDENGKTWELSADHLEEMFLPVSTVGKQYVTAPIAMRSSGDVFRIVGCRDDTSVNVTSENGCVTYFLDKGQFLEINASSTTFQHIESNKQIVVVQYCKTGNVEPTNSDPFMMVLPSVEQYDNAYTTSTTTGLSGSYDNFVTLVTLTKNIAGLLMDGSSLNDTVLGGFRGSYNWTHIPGSKYSACAIWVEHGTHTFTHSDPTATFAIYAYGHAPKESYGFSGGFRMAPLYDFCVATSMTPGDGLDNDCDGRVDEELWNDLDDDGDGTTDEDLVQDGDYNLTSSSSSSYVTVHAITLMTTTETENSVTLLSTPSNRESQDSSIQTTTISNNPLPSTISESAASQILSPTLPADESAIFPTSSTVPSNESPKESTVTVEVSDSTQASSVSSSSKDTSNSDFSSSSTLKEATSLSTTKSSAIVQSSTTIEISDDTIIQTERLTTSSATAPGAMSTSSYSVVSVHTNFSPMESPSLTSAVGPGTAVTSSSYITTFTSNNLVAGTAEESTKVTSTENEQTISLESSLGNTRYNVTYSSVKESMLSTTQEEISASLAKAQSNSVIINSDSFSVATSVWSNGLFFSYEHRQTPSSDKVPSESMTLHSGNVYDTLVRLSSKTGSPIYTSDETLSPLKALTDSVLSHVTKPSGPSAFTVKDTMSMHEPGLKPSPATSGDSSVDSPIEIPKNTEWPSSLFSTTSSHGDPSAGAMTTTTRRPDYESPLTTQREENGRTPVQNTPPGQGRTLPPPAEDVLNKIKSSLNISLPGDVKLIDDIITLIRGYRPDVIDPNVIIIVCTVVPICVLLCCCVFCCWFCGCNKKRKRKRQVQSELAHAVDDKDIDPSSTKSDEQHPDLFEMKDTDKKWAVDSDEMFIDKKRAADLGLT